MALARANTLTLLGRKKNTPVTLSDQLGRIAKQGGKARMDALTKNERSALASKGGKAGGKARAESLTSEERSRIARKAALEMWRKRRRDEGE